MQIEKLVSGILALLVLWFAFKLYSDMHAVAPRDACPVIQGEVPPEPKT